MQNLIALSVFKIHHRYLVTKANQAMTLQQGKQIIDHLMQSGEKNVQVIPVTILVGS